MKKNKILFVFLIFLTFLLSACGIQSKENMKINNKFKGERIILLRLDSQTYNSAIGGKDAVIKFFSENIISPLELNYIKDEANTLEVEYSIKFDNKDDYINKIKILYTLGNIEDDIKVDFNIDDERFNKSVKFFDNSDVQKILSSLINKALEDGLISEDNLSNLWNAKKYSLMINGNQYIQDSDSTYGDFSKSEYIGPSEINVFTSRSEEENKFNRVITLFFNKENYEKLDKGWQDDFISNEKVNFEINNEDSSAKFIYENFSDEEINRETAKFFGADSDFSMTYKNGGEKLKIIEILKDKITENEISNKSNVKYLYYFDKNKIDNLINQKDISRDENNEKIVYAENRELIEGIEKSIETNIIFDKINVETLIGSDYFKRTISFPKDSQKELIESNLEEYLKSQKIDYLNSKDNLAIEYRYDYESGSDIHKKIYKTLVDVQTVEGKPFKSTKKLVENAEFKELKAKKINNFVKTEELTRINNQNFKQDGNNIYNYNVVFETTPISSIFNVLASIFAIIIIIFLIFRYLSVHKAKPKFEEPLDDQMQNKEKKDRKILDEERKKI